MRQPVIELSGAKALGNVKRKAAPSGVKLMRARAA